MAHTFSPLFTVVTLSAALLAAPAFAQDSALERDARAAADCLHGAADARSPLLVQRFVHEAAGSSLRT